MDFKFTTTMKKKYIIPKTQVKTVSTEMPIATSVTVNSEVTVESNNGAWAKKGMNIWEEEDQ